MHPILFRFLDRDIAAYGVFMVLGIGLGFLIAILLYKPLGIGLTIKRSDMLMTGGIAIAGVMIGAVLLRPVIRLPEVIINWDKYSQVPVGIFLSWYFGEMVFYGGLIGGLVAALFFCRGFKIPISGVSDAYAVAIPVGHAVGRIGCLLGGCCYGIEVSHSHPFAVIYPEHPFGLESAIAPAGVPILAIPVIEAAGNLIIAGIILVLQFKHKVDGRAIALYGILYSIQRFVLEFFRGDLVRGVYGIVSTSQMISIVILIVSVSWFVSVTRKKSKEKPQSV